MTIKPIETPPYTEYQGWSEWEDKFKPIKNHFRPNEHNEQMFETYGEEVDFVCKADNKCVWTYIQGDYSMLLVAGYHYVNRLGYYITELPWENEDDYVLVSVDSECDCYDEETAEGNDDCNECEGYGMITRYID